MIFYILKFVNEVMGATVSEKDRIILREEMANTKYSFIIEQVKLRLEEGFYKLENSTFINVSQQIYKYASKGKIQYKNSVQPTESKGVRNTLSMKDLEQHLVMNFFEMVGKANEEPESADENEDEFMTVYLT